MEGIVFPDAIVGEDAFVYFDILQRVKKAVYITSELYYYYKRNNSLSRTKVYSEEQLESILRLKVKRSVRWRDILHELQYYDLEKQCVNIEIFDMAGSAAVFADTRKKRKLYKKYVKELVVATKDTKNALSFKDNIRLSVFLFSPLLYRKILALLF